AERPRRQAFAAHQVGGLQPGSGGLVWASVLECALSDGNQDAVALPLSADQDQGYSSCWGRSSRISCHGAFEPTNMCAVGLSAGSSMSDPYATRTYVPSRAVQ